MKRRAFLVSGLAGAVGVSSLAMARESKDEDKREYFELRRYHLLNRARTTQLEDFLRDAGIAAMNRIGIKPVGVFNVVYGPNSPTLYVLLVHKSLESVVQASSRLMAELEPVDRAASYLNAPLAEPAYVRYESSLMVAFSHMPKLEAPEKKQRMFELRTYESHSIKAAKKKIEMFNEGGEIAIFRKTGLQPVFFGETVIGPQLPNLTYMLVFESMAERDKKWKVFGGDPDWKKLRANPAYADTVSNITDIILRPASYSQI
jgi:hypothetical protein